MNPIDVRLYLKVWREGKEEFWRDKNIKKN